jgi:hypothetical protein
MPYHGRRGEKDIATFCRSLGAALRKSVIKMEIPDGPKVRVAISHMAKEQHCLSKMIGYIQKDSSKDHYQSMFINVLPDDAEACRGLHQIERRAWSQGKTYITRKNMLTLMMNGRLRYFDALNPGPGDALMGLYWSGEFVPSPTLGTF